MPRHKKGHGLRRGLLGVALFQRLSFRANSSSHGPVKTEKQIVGKKEEKGMHGSWMYSVGIMVARQPMVLSYNSAPRTGKKIFITNNRRKLFEKI